MYGIELRLEAFVLPVVVTDLIEMRDVATAGDLPPAYRSLTVMSVSDNVITIGGFKNKEAGFAADLMLTVRDETMPSEYEVMGGSVTGSGNGVGGLVGANVDSAAISNSYASGAVTGPMNAGGLVGVNDTGATVTYSYWDTNTTGQMTSARDNGNGRRPTAQMTNATAPGATDSDVYFSWDAATIWSFSGSAYPTLQSVVCPIRQSDPTVDCP